YPEISVETFVTRGPEDPNDPFLAVVVDVDSILRFDVPVDELIAAHLDVRGRYVKLAVQDEANRQGDEGRLIGRVRDATRQRLRLVGDDGRPLPIAADLTMTVGEAVEPAPASALFPTRDLPAAVFSFDPESPKTDEKATSGLRRFGPYDQLRMRGQRPAILVV